MKAKQIYTYYLKAIFLLIGITTISFSKSQEKLYEIKINVHYEMSQPGDTIYLDFVPAYSSTYRKNAVRTITTVGKNNIAHFNILQQYPYGYVSIYKSKQFSPGDFTGLATNLFWETGDEISIYIKHPTELSKREYFYDTKFKGVNENKYTAIYNVKKAFAKVQENRRQNNKNKLILRTKYDFSPLNDIEGVNYLLSVLDSSKTKLSSFSYQVLKTDILMRDISFKIAGFIYLVDKQGDISLKTRDSIINNLRLDYFPILNLVPDQRALAASKNLINFYVTLFYTIRRLQPDYEDKKVVEDILANSSGILQEALLTNFLNVSGYSAENRDLFDIVYKYLNDEYYLNMFNHIKSKSEINVGKYILTDIEGNKVSLSNFKGKFLLLDFWSTGCGGCIVYRQNILSKIEEKYKDDNRIQIISINLDKDINRWKNSVNLDTYANPNGINLYTSGLELRHPLTVDLGLSSLPTGVLIDTNGNVLDNYSINLKYLHLLRELLVKHLN